MGETFAGIEFERGVELSHELAWIAEGRGNMTRAALRWIIDHDAISCVIPGFKNVRQVEDNLTAVEVPSFSRQEKAKLEQFYGNKVHQWIRGPY